jgi:hypothetical protein
MKALHFRRWACAIFVTGASATAAAQNQTVYRCGSTYSDTPCTQGVAVPTADPRTPAQKAQTDEATTRAAGLAGQLEKTRRADETAAAQRAQTPALAVAHIAKARPQTRSGEGRHGANKGVQNKKATGAAVHGVNTLKLSKPKKPDGFTVKVPGPGKPQTQPKP